MIGRRIHAGPATLATLFAVLLILALAGCARRSTARVPASPFAPARIGDTETGIASWYGAPYDGRPSASGEIYDMTKLTAAHRSLSFGAWVEVTNLDNGRRVKVRIIDRGPLVEGRVIDLSHEAARRIDMLRPGTARVRLKVIAAPTGVSTRLPPVQLYAVQAGAFSNRDRAETLRVSLKDRFEDARVVENAQLWHVLVGHRMTFDAAKKLAAEVRNTAGEALAVPDR